MFKGPFRKRSFGRRRWVSVAAIAAVVAAALAWFAARVPISSEILRKRLVTTLAERLDAEVELGALSLQVFPRFEVRGENLIVHHKPRRAVPPLFSIKTFTVDADLVGLWRRHVAYVKLDGLEIQIPPDEDDDGDSPPKDGAHFYAGRQVIVDLVEAPGAKLTILPKRLGKAPKVWHLHSLRIEAVSARTSMPFSAVLTNAIPPGQIETSGSFGPWHRDDPGHAALDGRYTFENADLSVFKGIGGILSAHGVYGGTLERIDVKGETNTPDFVVNVGGHKVPLKTKYHAVVDGTNGDTRLEQIDASFLNTSLTAKGGVFDVEGVKGRLVTLDVSMDRARLEDVMRLAVKSAQPPMTGALRLKTQLELPPGDLDVIDKLKLNGRFSIENGRFTNADVQQRINGLSRRASVKPSEQRPVNSDFAGSFVLRSGVLALPSLRFNVPGALVELNGRYGLRSETLAFAGELVMDAKLSQTTTGFKSLLLNAVDPVFRKDDHTVIPLKITGTRDQPSFGVDVKRVFTRRSATESKRR